MNQYSLNLKKGKVARCPDLNRSYKRGFVACLTTPHLDSKVDYNGFAQESQVLIKIQALTLTTFLLTARGAPYFPHTLPEL